MQKSLKWIVYGFAAVLGAMYLQLFLFRGNGAGEPDGLQPDHHIKILCNDVDTYFYAEFERGVRRAEEDYNVFVELDGVNQRDDNALSGGIRLAIFAGVDGVAFQSVDQAMILELCEFAEQRGVELMLFESENHQNAPVVAASSNSYSIGMRAGELALEAAGGEACQAVVIVDRTENELPSTYQNMKVQGVMDAFSGRPGAELVEVFTIGSGLMDGESLAGILLSLQNSYDTIICLHEKTTPLIAQRLLDGGLVGSVQLVGYGALPQTLEYIERGVVYGAVCPDAYDVGYHTVALMCARLEHEQVEDYSSTRLFTITKDNLGEFDALWNGVG